MFELFDPGSDFHISHGTNLSHWFQPGVTYFITFRTEDSIPASISARWYAERNDWLLRHGIQSKVTRWRDRLAQLPENQRREFHETFSTQYRKNLDKGLGSCVLRRPELSKIVANSLLHFDNNRYHLGDFVVMPNHVHLLVGLLGDTEVEAQCYSWKKYTATRINLVLGQKGRFWQEESFNHLVRSPEQFEAIRIYIAENPKTLPIGHYHLYQMK